MPAFALIVVGFVFGWLLCAFILISVRTGVLDFPWFVFDSEWRQPSPKGIADALADLTDEKSATSKRRYASVRFWFGVTVFCATVFLIVVELLQDLRFVTAAALEDAVTEPRCAALVLASAIGFAARLYRRQIVAGINTLSEIALVGGDKSKDNKSEARGDDGTADDSKGDTANDYTNARFPWYIEVGLLLSIVLVAVFWINPQLLKNLTSFKAGGVEAHFATATGTATVQSGLIVTIDPARKTIAQNWASFDYPDANDSRFSTYIKNDEKDVLPEVKEKMEDAGLFFKDAVKPIFSYLSKLYETDSSLAPELNGYLETYAVSLSRALRESGKNARYVSNSINAALSQICKQQYSFTDAHGACLLPPQIDEATLSRKTWDPYIIQAVGDLLLVLKQRRDQEDFLFATYKRKAGAGICAGGCRTSGELSLMYDVVLTKVRSQRPWLFKDTLKELTDTLDGVDAVLDRNEVRWARNQSAPQARIECLCEKTNSLFRRNRFMDLALGLELFYQRDLQGQRFTPAQMQLWRDWLAELRGVVDTLDDGIAAWPPPFADEVRKSWIRAKADIRSRPDMLQDAYVGIALSLVLIGSTDGEVSERDCNTAHAFLLRADDKLQPYFEVAHLDADDEETYKGFLEQVRTSVDGRCRP